MTRRKMNSVDNSIPEFLTKLWTMIEDPKTDDIICWSKNGSSFLIRDEKKFWYTLLPVYYKHNNMSSFIRQLNMYGFHKLRNIPEYYLEKEEKHDYKFIHPHFRKGKIELLNKIKRKTAPVKLLSGGNTNEEPQQLNQVFSDVQTLYNRQNQVETVLNNLKQENAVLWQELALLRQKHQNQQQIVNKLIHFFVTMVRPTNLRDMVDLKRRPLMIHATPPKRSKSNTDGPTIHELDNIDDLMEDMSTDINTVCDTQKSGDELLNNLELPEEEEKGDVNCIPTLHIPETFEKDVADILPDSDQVFLDSNAQDAQLLSRFLNGNYSNVDSNNKISLPLETNDADNMSVATCGSSTPNPRLNTMEDIDNYLGITQGELDKIKKIFNNCNSVDTKYLLQLFNEPPSYGLTPNGTWDALEKPYFVDGTEVAPYDPELIDFNHLLDSPIDSPEFIELPKIESLNTPDVMELKPTFLQKTTKD